MVELAAAGSGGSAGWRVGTNPSAYRGIRSTDLVSEFPFGWQTCCAFSFWGLPGGLHFCPLIARAAFCAFHSFGGAAILQAWHLGRLCTFFLHIAPHACRHFGSVLLRLSLCTVKPLVRLVAVLSVGRLRRVAGGGLRGRQHTSLSLMLQGWSAGVHSLCDCRCMHAFL